jgi:hypothetical protein
MDMGGKKMFNLSISLVMLCDLFNVVSYGPNPIWVKSDG